MLKSLMQMEQDFLNIVGLGQSGSGKTFLISTLPGKKLILALEQGGIKSLHGKPDIDVYDCCVDGNNNELARERRIDKLNYFLKEILPTIKDNYNWLCVDGLTELSQLLVEQLEKKYPDKSNTFLMWGEYNKTLRTILKDLRDIRINTYMTCLDAIEKDDAGRRYVTFDVNGKISNRIPALFDEILYLKEFEENGKPVRKLITGNYQNILAKDRSGRLSLIEDADLSKILNKIKGE
jgi:phage nucleotide-binding protein